MMRMEEIGEGGVESSSTSSSRCKDCGNQAKRDCEHMRCRTCCKSRGFQCQTHVKSTWVPVSRRRPRHLIMHHHHQISPSSALLHDHHHHNSTAAAVGGPPPNPKRYRDNNNQAAVAALGLEEGDFPGEVSFPAVFRCVRVSSIDNVVDQYAYQTSVSIGGHVFTGILYDQGAEPEGTVNYVTGGSSSSGGGGGIGLLQQHNFVGGGGGGGAAGNTGTTPSSYPTPSPFYAFTSSQFFQYPKS
ncbi:hypothetical protein ABFX02_02G019300 [Erythranthe guttata]